MPQVERETVDFKLGHYLTPESLAFAGPRTILESHWKRG
jgi:hypothetical protein